MPAYSLVDRPDTIRSELRQQHRIGVDTEFMRERTFFAELCLVQISTPDHIFCIDPLAGGDMQAFWDNATARTWVLHSARQDIEVIYQTSQRMPQRIFDTQIAAGLLGYAPQLGYAGLVSELFGVEIAKTHTRADWSRRPLSDALLQYAAEDVKYLLPAHELLAARLEQQGRLAWAEEDSAQLLEPALYDLDPQLAIDRLRGAKNLHGASRAAATRLAVWRETEALRANRPRQWIARDAALLSLARSLPTSIEELQEIEGLAPGLVRRSGRNVLAAIAASREDNNKYRPPAAPDEAEKALLKRMQAAVIACAADLGLANETVASRKDLAAVIAGADSRVLRGWRREVIGAALLELV
ncbi:MAG: ribonuclease D [Gammaproteobacteria bacterium]|nr:ribonuclease D [Gammaproteobacteria bacterium]